tara:strand:- start:458 stop:1285 length:828 start_codon:yes stop_codon:yes gene_type:complete
MGILGLGNTLMHGSVPSSFLPSNISNMLVWLRYNVGITSDMDDGGSSKTEVSSDAGTMVDDDRINQWNDASGNGRHAQGPRTSGSGNSDGSDDPRWTSSDNSLDFASNSKWMDFVQVASANIVIPTETDFSVVMFVKFTDLATNRCLFGHNANNLLQIKTNKKIQVRIGDNTNSMFEEASDTLSTGTYYCITLVRSNGATGNINLYVNGGGYSDKDWDAAENHTDTDVATISNIGAHADDTNKLNGFVKSFIVYQKALDATDRANLYNYYSDLFD